MIGDFLFSAEPIEGVVMVAMGRDSDGSRHGSLVVPAIVDDEMAEYDYPSAQGAFPVASAIAYGLIIAMKTGRPLVLTGDRSAWSADWGILIDVADRIGTGICEFVPLGAMLATRH